MTSTETDEIKMYILDLYEDLSSQLYHLEKNLNERIAAEVDLLRDEFKILKEKYEH